MDLSCQTPLPEYGVIAGEAPVELLRCTISLNLSLYVISDSNQLWLIQTKHDTAF